LSRHIDASSATLDDLDIGTADWVVAGEPIMHTSWDAYARSDSQSFGTYSNHPTDFFQAYYQHDEIAPTDSQANWVLTLRVEPPSGETVDVRATNFVDNETILEKTGIDTTGQYVISESYTPSSPSTPISILLEGQSSGGSQYTLAAPNLSVGYQL